MTDRITCSVFGCKRWSCRKGDHDEMICRDHWRTVPKDLRGLFHRAKRRVERQPTGKNIASYVRFWNRCVKYAEGEQFGIGVL